MFLCFRSSKHTDDKQIVLPKAPLRTVLQSEVDEASNKWRISFPKDTRNNNGSSSSGEYLFEIEPQPALGESYNEIEPSSPSVSAGVIVAIELKEMGEILGVENAQEGRTNALREKGYRYPGFNF